MADTAPRARRRIRKRTPRAARLGIIAIAGISAVAAALSPARPVGSRPADVVWCVLIGAAIPLVASRARRWPLIWAGGVAAVVGVGGDWTAKAGTLVLLLLVALITFSDRRDRLEAAAVGALAVNVLLRGPSFGFVGLPTVIGFVALVPLLWSGYRMAHRRERRVGLTIAVVLLVLGVALGALAGVSALRSRDDLRAGADEATAALDQLRSGDTSGAADRFRLAASDFDAASGPLDGWMTWGGRFVPIVGQHVDALRTAASSGEALGLSAATTSSTADYRTLTATDGTVDLERVAALTAPVTDSADVIQRSLAAVSDARSPWLVAPVGDELARFEEKLSDAGDQASIAAEALAVAPDLLGAGRPRRYFIAFGTPGESRNAGGYVGAYGVLTTDEGRLTLSEAGNLNALNPTGEPYAFEPPPDWEQRYGSYYVQYFLGNLGASPDWPTDLAVIDQLYPQTPGGTDIDGAIYVDPAAIAGLLQLTGPVQIPELNVVLDASNAERFLLQDQYVLIDGNNPQRKELLGDAARATFDALTSRPLPGISTLTEVLGPLVAGGHLKVSVDQPGEEAFLDRVGLSGRWAVEPGADVVSLRWSNLLANKIDSFIHRDITIDTTVDPSNGRVVQDVTVTVRNDAPPAGLPSYVIGNASGLPEGTSRDTLALYSPHGLDSATVDGVDVRTLVQSEFAMPVYSLTVEVPPQGTRTVVFRLSGRVPAWPYHLQVLPQPMANTDQLTVAIDAPGRFGPAPQFSGTLDQPLVIGPTEPDL